MVCSCIHNTYLQSVSEEIRKASQIETDSNSSGYVIMVEKIQTDI